MNRYVEKKNKIIQEVKAFEVIGHKEKMEKLYRKFPETQCLGCGECCKDSPVVAYPEFLFALTDFYNDEIFDKDRKIKVYKNAVKGFMFGLINKDVHCPFWEKTAGCTIYKRSPISCKRWGLQSKKENDRDLVADHQRNKEYKEYFAKYGIDIPDETINYTTPFCENVKIIRNPYNFVSRDFETVVMKEMVQIIPHYIKKMQNDWSIGHYLIHSIFGNQIFEDRIRVIKNFQSGNEHAVEEYINGINFEEFV